MEDASRPPVDRPREATAAAGLSDYDAAPPVPELPDAVIECILQRVPLDRRLTVCSCVCKAWAAAAVRSTSSLQIVLKTRQDAARRLPLLQRWWTQSKQQLTSLLVDSLDRQLSGTLGTLQLPCSRLTQLQELTLAGLDVGLPAAAPLAYRPDADRAAGLAAAPSSDSAEATQLATTHRRPLLPALRHLRLVWCTLDTTAGLVHLAWAPFLTSLQLVHTGISGAGGTVPASSSDVPGSGASTLNRSLRALLEQLPGLRALVLVHPQLQSTTLHSITAMQSLQDLLLCLGTVRRADPWPRSLPAGLTKLLVRNETVCHGEAAWLAQPRINFIAASAQWLGSLQDAQWLQELRLDHCELDPVLLGCITGLRKLDLVYCQLLPGTQDGTRALLSTLRGLTQLQHIELMLEPPSVEGVAPELFAALTASQQLSCLSFGSYLEQPLPRGAMQHLFPAGCCMLQLRELDIIRTGDEEPDKWCVHDGDLCSIAGASPSLHKLGLKFVVPPGASLSAVRLLPPSLTSLTVWGPAFGDAAAAAVAQLTQLHSFEWDCAPGLSDVGFQHLTALTGLTSLSANRIAARFHEPIGLSDDLFRGTADPGRKVLDLCSTNEKGPVWQQVQAMCSNSPACDQLPAPTCGRQAAALQQETISAELQQQLALQNAEGHAGQAAAKTDSPGD